ncbi:MAG: 23S rRNA (uracil(1939)-C(5))-methyltransferase RlmD [Woeseia sp.]
MATRRQPETATIDAVTHDGRGIAAIDGKKVFVPGALPGERVRILRRKFRRGYDEADLLEIESPSAERITPRCAAFGVCGGCSLQHVADVDQRSMKQKSLEDSLERIGGVSPERWLPPIFDPDPEGSWRYRRRARLAVRDVAGKGRVLVGFRERRAGLVTDMHRCEVLAPPLDGLIDPLSELIARLSIRNRLPQIEVAVAANAVELVFRVLDAPTVDDRAELSRFAREHRLRISLQPGGIGSVEPLDLEAAGAALYYELPEFDVRIRFEATDFIQVNTGVNRLMVTAAVDLLQLQSTDRVLDLFCGIGNFSLPLARGSAEVLGIEGDSAQVSRARQNAELNGIGNCEFRCGDLAAIDGKERWIRQCWDKVLLDPPRCGAEEVVRHLAKIGAARLVCVSCHPATLARDAAILTKTQGYRLEAAGIVDMFPHTAHAEAIALFSKAGRARQKPGP